MKKITYEKGIDIVSRLLNELEVKAEITPKNKVEYSILHDCLIFYKTELTNELERQKLIHKFNNFNK